eukprot:TRINITY_DN29291_c0_g1_i2.p1 TRINITY_DN29291_c0_g1~~TRINITY_DN29291_c0_g1_i2.p1  ORF type:complete len:250 (-),score=40.10 TRINITY_DN29291_c0_g1_i2:183-932(-)
MVQARLFSGKVIDVPVQPEASVAEVRRAIAAAVDAPVGDVALLLGTRFLQDDDLGQAPVDGELTLVLSARTTATWLEDFLSGGGATTGASSSGGVSELRHFHDVAAELRKRVAVTQDMASIAGLWKYGPRSHDDPRFYGLLLHRDGTCKVLEGCEDFGGGSGSTEGSCEWRGIWTRDADLVNVQAFPVFETVGGTQDVLPAPSEAVLGSFRLQEDDPVLRRESLTPVNAFEMWRLASIPKSRSLVKVGR